MIAKPRVTMYKIQTLKETQNKDKSSSKRSKLSSVKRHKMSKSISVNLSEFYNLKPFKVSDNSLSKAYDLDKTRSSLQYPKMGKFEMKKNRNLKPLEKLKGGNRRTKSISNLKNLLKHSKF